MIEGKYGELTYMQGCGDCTDDTHEEVEVGAEEGGEGPEGQGGGQAGGAEVGGEGEVETVGDQNLGTNKLSPVGSINNALLVRR